ncbi:Uncharacterised protein [Klebsiella pneumoniae]|nr:Uncharacterised protein [Klebsiella pneumoniae]
MMSLWDALRMNMMISYQELVRTFPSKSVSSSITSSLVLAVIFNLMFLTLSTVEISMIHPHSYRVVVK